MGLDMYLTLNLEDGTEIEELMYWRKANHIHAWFVKNVQNGIDECDRFKVSREHLESLKEACTKVLVDRSLAESLLPTQQGFFFGGTEYDEYYFKDIVDTLICVVEILYILDHGGFDNGCTINYQSSWQISILTLRGGVILQD